MIIRSISLHSEYRETIGTCGGVEALFLLCKEHERVETQTNAYWALGNLAWDPFNQTRIGKYFEDLIRGCQSSFAVVQSHALCCLSNLVCYNENNRNRLLRDRGLVDLVLKMCSDDRSEDDQYSALRTLVSVSYLNTELSTQTRFYIPTLISRCSSPNTNIKKNAAITLLNLLIDSKFKCVIVENKGVKTLTHMVKSKFSSVREIAIWC